jgi:OFA family oxalate/formate antiporter-like MFS transporter
MRYLILLASFLVQLCLGGIYAWSTFVPHLIADHALTTAQTQLIFGLLFAAFTGAMVFAGKILERKGPRWLLVTSGALFFGGYLVAANSGGSFALLLLGISGLAGVATGIGYVCPLSTCVKWFPNHKGLVTGIAVAGFGAGAIVLAYAAEAMIAADFGVLTIFGWMGAAYGSLILLSATVMRFPTPPTTPTAARSVGVRDVVGNVFFWALCTAIFCGTFAGLMVVGSLSALAGDYGISRNMAALSVSSLAVGNGLGRIIWGQVVDRIGQRAVLPSLLTLAIVVALLIPATIDPRVFALAACAVGFGFGANFVIYAALTAERFGPHRVGDVYPLVFLSYGVAGITGPMLGGWLRDETGGYVWSTALAVAVLCGGMVASALLLRKARQPREKSLCSTCNYNLRGNATEVCPECGTPITHPVGG